MDNQQTEHERMVWEAFDSLCANARCFVFSTCSQEARADQENDIEILRAELGFRREKK